MLGMPPVLPLLAFTMCPPITHATPPCHTPMGGLAAFFACHVPAHPSYDVGFLLTRLGMLGEDEDVDENAANSAASSILGAPAP